MKLGSQSASPLEGLRDLILPQLKESTTDNDVVQAKSQPMDDEEAYNFWDQLRKDACSRKQIFGTAHSYQTERELTERFGIFKAVALHPYVRQVMQLTESTMKARVLGKSVVPIHTCVILLFMAYQGRMPWIKFVLLASLLFTVHPALTIAGLLFFHTLSLPKGRNFQTGPRDGCAVNVLVYGGGLRGLYSGALLARAGRRVTVLVPQSTNDAVSTTRPEGAPCDFVLERCEFGQVLRYAGLLSPCIHPNWPVDFEPVGNSKTGWAHGVLVSSDHCQPFPLRTGAQAWIDDRSREFGVDRGVLVVAARQAMNVACDISAFVAGKLPDESGLLDKLRWNEDWPALSRFALAAETTAAEASTASLLRHWALPREEQLTRDQISVAAWSTSIIHGINGYHVPKGGAPCLCASLEATIRAHGGRVITSMTVRDVKLAKDRKNPAVVVAAPNGAYSRPQTFTAEEVILAVDIPECYNLLHRARLGVVLSAQEEDFPKQFHAVMRTLIAFSGTCREFDAPHAVPIFWRKHACSRNLDLDWKTFTLRDAPNGIVACVVEGPDLRYTSNSHGLKNTEDKNHYHNSVLGRLARIFPRTEGKAIYIASLETSTYRFSHTLGGYAGIPWTSGLERFHVALDVFPLSDGAGAVVAGYLAAHAALDYKRGDFSHPECP